MNEGASGVVLKICRDADQLATDAAERILAAAAEAIHARGRFTLALSGGATLARAFGMARGGAPPRFALILLGLGDDGHTASLFPGAAALNEEQAWVTWSPPGTLPPPVDRVTLTYPTLNAARQILFLVAGANKAEPLRDVLERQAPRDLRPAAGVRPTDGTVTWLLDE